MGELLIFPDLHRYPFFALDTETDGLIYPINKAFGFSVSTPDGKDFYWDIREDPQAIDFINDEMEGYGGTIICHNASFDAKMARAAGINIPLERMDDTVIRAVQIDEHLHAYDLDSLGKKYINARKRGDIYADLAAIFGGRATKNVQMKNLHLAPSSLVGPYAKQDTRVTLDLWRWQEEEIARQGLEPICKFERSLMPTLMRAEMHGVRVDEDYAEQAMDKMTPLIDKAQAKLNEMAGGTFNSNSPKQVKELFKPVETEKGWVASDGTPLPYTGTGAASVGSEVLRTMKHPAAALILALRSDIKTRDTFLASHVLGSAHHGRVYPCINQSKGEDGGTGTGRLSIVKPALQQIPSRNKVTAAIVKPCFLPDEGQIWLDTDMNSFEVRIFAGLVKNPKVLAAYRANPLLDLHQFTADLTNLVRNATYSGEPNAKQLNLSMIFNSGDGATADKMGMPWEWESFTAADGEQVTYKKPGPEATAIIAKYHANMGGVKELANRAKQTALNRGYIFTSTGRRLRFPNGFKAYKASGLLIQATSADYNKKNWLKITEALGDDGRLLLNTHDSYSLSVPEDWKPIMRRVKESVESTDWPVPLILDVNGVGKNWWEAVKKDE